jgi:hypothetical protein
MQFTEQTVASAKQATDYALATGGLASYWWYQYLEQGIGAFVFIGGAALLALRLYLTVLEAIKAHRRKKED